MPCGQNFSSKFEATCPSICIHIFAMSLVATHVYYYAPQSTELPPAETIVSALGQILTCFHLPFIPIFLGYSHT
jgi:hypothetical protein